MAKHDGNYHNETLQAYFDQIKRTPLLSFDEEIELSKRIQRGDDAAKQRLIEANLRLVVKIAKGFMTNDVALLDLVQEGNLGLIRAASKYDHRKNVRFSTYASWWIKQAISRALSNKRRPIRLPHRKENALRKIQRAQTVLSQSLMREPTIQELAHEVGLDSAEVDKICGLANTMVSLDSEINDEDSGTFHDVFEDYSYSPDAVLMKDSMREETLRFLERLKERERQILLYRFAFIGGKKHTLKSISEEMGISPETVRQIEIRALKRLRQEADVLREYVMD
ncbi:MAG: sigma-70 family RNA polymerase sigma factor [Spirochaetes bacterium]|jgi:RNA polymerase primary sigma factor|nr:sigma-70 family RNA polymerase sigma factor [Spirochaetota bacterium]